MPIITPKAHAFPTQTATPVDAACDATKHLFLANNTPIAAIHARLSTLELIVIDFPSITDGRGLSLAKTLRDAGYQGVLRAKGELTPDQYPMALLCGFDEVEITEERLTRQPRHQWQDVPQVHLWRERLSTQDERSNQAA